MKKDQFCQHSTLEEAGLQGKCFDVIFIIYDVINKNISEFDNYKTLPDFYRFVENLLNDKEYIKKLDINEHTINEARKLLKNNEFKLDKSFILNHFIKRSGLKVGFVIDKLGINRTTYYRKIENDFNFSRSELITLKDILSLTDDDFLKLF